MSRQKSFRANQPAPPAPRMPVDCHPERNRTRSIIGPSFRAKGLAIVHANHPDGRLAWRVMLSPNSYVFATPVPGVGVWYDYERHQLEQSRFWPPPIDY